MSQKTLLVALTVLCLFLFFFRLGDRSLRNPDEGRYAEIAREMVVSDNWVEPTLYGIDYLRKPILFYWLVALSFKFFGFTEFAARLVPALFGLLGVVLTYFFAERFFGKKTALFSAAILATNPWYLEMSRFLLIDAVFSFFLTASFYAAYAWFRLKKRVYLNLFYVSTGLAFLSKGLAGVVIPAFGLLIYFLWRRRPAKELFKMLSLPGLVIFFAIVLPWFFSISAREPGFLNSFFLHEHFSRYLSKTFEHQEPWYFYLILLPVLFLPWSFFPAPLHKMIEPPSFLKADLRPYIGSFFVAIFIFYSVSGSKLVTYLMPAIPLGAMFLGKSWVSWTQNESKYLASGQVGLATIIVAAALAFSSILIVVSPLFETRLGDLVPPEVRVYLLSALVLALVVFGSLIYWILQEKRNAVFLTIIAFLSVGSVLLTFSMEAMNQSFTTKHFAEKLKLEKIEGQTVYVYGSPGAFYDFSFYLNRPVKLVGLEGELERSQADPRAQEVAVTLEEWTELLKSGRIITLMRRSDYEGLDKTLLEYMRTLSQDRKKILIESRPKGI